MKALICHVGFVVDDQPYVIPTIHVRMGETLYFHGSPASRMLKALEQGVEVCVAVTLVDGLVLARSAFHHSMNYRSAVVFGTAHVVAERRKTSSASSMPSRIISSKDAGKRSEPIARGVEGTLVLSLPITEASAKVRTGPPVDDEEDYALPVWAGVLPLKMTAGEPVADPRLSPGLPLPSHVAQYSGPGPAP